MYVEGQAINSLKKFRDYVIKYQASLNDNLAKIEAKLSIKNIIEKIKVEKDYNFILENKDLLISLDSNLESKFKVIEFLVKNQATSAEQFMIVVSEIINSDIINNFEKTVAELLQTKEKIKRELEQCILIISDDNYNYQYYVKLLELSDLSEQDKINILSEQAFKTIDTKPQIEIDTQDADNQPEQIDTQDIDTLDVSSDSLESRYRQIIMLVNDIIAKYYYLIEKQDGNQLKYKKSFINAMRDQDGRIDFGILASVEDRLILLILKMIENKQLIEQEMKRIVDHTIDREDETVINLFIDELEQDLKDAQETSEQLDLDGIEKKNTQSSKVLLLLDEKGQPYINIKESNSETNKRILALIQELENGVYDYGRGFKHSKLLYDDKSVNIYINRSSNISCSYIRLTNDIVLLLAIGDFKDIYDFTKYIHKKNREIIDNYSRLTEDELINLIQSQSDILKSMYEYLSTKEDVKK